jgi:uncharacterized membrane protein
MSIAAFEIIQFVLRLVLAVAFIFMGVTHFLPAVQRTMSAMVPPRMRWAGLASPRNLVVFTGVCEIAGGLGIVYPPTTLAAGVCLVIFLVAVFPANMHAAAHPERFGRVAIPLVPRLIGQLVLIVLVVLAVV